MKISENNKKRPTEKNILVMHEQKMKDSRKNIETGRRINDTRQSKDGTTQKMEESIDRERKEK